MYVKDLEFSRENCGSGDFLKGLAAERKAKKKYKMELSVLGATWV